MKNAFNHLTTEYEDCLKEGVVPFSEYPRPQLIRDSYLCLNGEWDFEIIGKTPYVGKILVPFVPESRISGVFKEIKKRDVLVYKRNFTIDEGFIKDKVFLHVGACDQFAKVYVNEILVKENEGILPFSVDVTSLVKTGINTIKIVATDPLDKTIPYGKQKVKRGGMWYTKTSGIWQTVWMESTVFNPISSIKIKTDLNGVDILVNGGESEKKIILLGKEYGFTGNKIRIDIENPVHWSPENPHLYYFDLISGDDKVTSYFGLRTVDIGTNDGRKAILINGKPIFFHGLLDQGYYSDGIVLPASSKGFLDDVLKMKKCGFNMLRKHIKFEPDLFYYYCDKYGMFVFQDMVNSGRYSFLIDTALPTVFLKKGVSHFASKRRRKIFKKTALGVLDGLFNHPSVVYYTIFNEGWGQFSEKENYNLLKNADPSRIYDTTSGWFKKSCTDVESDHVYFKKIKPTKRNDKPWVLSEFGGYSYKINKHSFNPDKTYGYKFFTDGDLFEKAFSDLYETEIIPAIENGLCASVYTQVSDVEDETNGLLTYDRRILKMDENKLKEISNKLLKAFNKEI